MGQITVRLSEARWHEVNFDEFRRSPWIEAFDSNPLEDAGVITKPFTIGIIGMGVIAKN